MNKDLHNIDDLFKKALEEHEVIPSDQVWENIDKTLDKKKVIAISKKYNTLKWVAAALLLFSIGMAMYMVHMRSGNQELVKQNNSPVTSPHKKYKSDATLKNGSATVDNDSATADNKNNHGNKASLNNKTPTNDGLGVPNDLLKKTEDQENVDATPSGKINGKVTNSKDASILTPKQTDNNRKQFAIKKQSISEDGKDEDEFEMHHRKPRNATARVVITKIDASGESNNNIVANSENKSQKSKKNNGESNDEIYFKSIPAIIDYDKLIGIVQLNAFSPYLKSNTPNGLFAKNSVRYSTKQKIDLRNRNSHGFSATLFFSPDFVSSDLTNDHPMFREDDRNKFQQEERFKFSYTLGVLVDYNLSNKWQLESGFTYSKRITEIDPKIIFARPDNNGNINYRFNCSAGYTFVTLKSSTPLVSGDSIKTLPSTNALNYIGVPLSIRYAFSLRKLTILPGVGIGANFLTQGKIKTGVATTMGDEMATSNSIDGLKSTYFNGSASVGLQYQLSSAMGILFVPTMRFALTSINQDAPVKTDESSFGLAVGLNFRF